MEQCAYHSVNKIEDRSRKYFFRQLLVSIGVWSCYFSGGLFLGAPTVIIPQVRSEANTTDVITAEIASWISSTVGFSGIPWLFILPFTASRAGRKYSFMFVCICNMATFLLLYFSSTAEHLILAGIVQGPMNAAFVTITVIILTEYTSPEHRGLFLTLKSASLFWGVWAANTLGTFLHWKAISIAGMICASASTLISLFLCESPYWLASKYRFEACSRSHRWLKGNTDNSEKELSGLITYFRQIQNQIISEKQENSLKVLFRTIPKREFYKPALLCCAVVALYHTSGKLVCLIYAIDIIKEITSSESTAYTGMLILDGVTVAAMYVGAGLSKVVNRRTLLFTTTSFAIGIMFISSFYLALIDCAAILENKFVTIGLLMLFAASLGCGLMILSTSLYGELIPTKFKTSTMIVTALSSSILYAVTMKFAPFMFKTIKLYGAFLFYGTTSSIILFFLYKFLPETKDRTLQEINDTILLGRFDKENKN